MHVDHYEQTLIQNTLINSEITRNVKILDNAMKPCKEHRNTIERQTGMIVKNKTFPARAIKNCISTFFRYLMTVHIYTY